ncbi:MAG: hypothetical protein CUN55_05390 [Phototrophicales bacterium]|nr:MAG: hypothetical protein CUN55_05390 [Phototrophicales bacterium]
MNETLLSISHFIHLIATVTWIGGLLVIVFYIWPLSHKHLNDETHQQFILAFNKRYRPIANLSLVMLLGTGMLQVGADEHYQGLLTFKNTWTIAMLFKHLAFGGMMILGAIIQFSVVPAIERALLLASKDNGTALQAALQRENQLLRGMLVLGIFVLVFTAIATAV